MPVVRRTPPYVDQVRAGSAAADAGIRPDDLILLANDRLVPSQESLRAELEYVDYEDPIKLSVLRANALVEFELQARAKEQPPP